MNIIEYKKIKVFYTKDLDGGGTGFGQDYIPLIRDKFSKVDRIFEFCSGTGFIGFSLLANELCNSLCLADINPKAIELCKKTIKKNNLENKVSAYCSDVFDNIPTSEKWDLEVSNPPHFNSKKNDMILNDFNWNIHKKFYSQVINFLNPNASIILQECSKGSKPSDFKDMIAKGGLKFVDSFKYKRSLESDMTNSFKVGMSKHTNLSRIPSFLQQKFAERIDYPFYFIHSKNEGLRK